MAKQTINIGTSANKGDGDPLRTAFDKVNDNFDELYARDLGTDPESLGVNLAPSTNGGHDLGTADKRWADLYVRDFINLNGSTITVDGDGNFVFSKDVIANIRRQQDIVGSLFADDSSLAFDAQNSTFYGKFDGDLNGSVFADDSTLLVDGVNGIVPWSVIDDTPTTIAGYGITDAFTGVGDLTGSVFADDSTVLVDAVNGKLVGDYENSTSTITSTRVQSYDVKALQDTNTTDLYVVNKIYGGETGTIKNVAIGSIAPSTSNGASGDTTGMIALDSSYIYYCTANYTDGVADIWKRVAWSGDTW